MNEADTWWYKAIANHSHRLFTLVWGMGFGALLAFIFRLVDASGDTLRIYLAMLTVLMGGLLATISSRAMDRLSDRRQVIRKRFVALLRVKILMDDLTSFVDLIDELLPSMPNLSPQQAMNCYTRTQTARRVASEYPDFDDFLDTFDDVDNADHAIREFRFIETLFDFSGEKTFLQVPGYLVNLEVRGGIVAAIDALKNAGAHFSNQQPQEPADLFTSDK